MLHCNNCGFTNSSRANFCQRCGARLAWLGDNPGHSTSPAQPGATRDSSDRIRDYQALSDQRDTACERKTITILFADIAGSTAMIHDKDPEEANRILSPVIKLMIEAVHCYEGFVAKSLGDGIMALFGAPIALENHAQCALYSALQMRRAINLHNDQVEAEHRLPIQIRVGIHTGEVVMRPVRNDNLRVDYDPVGQSIHIAARMEAIAPPSSILVTEATFDLSKGYFEFKGLGDVPVKGIPNALAVYEVLGPGSFRTRLQVAKHRGLVPFVGRTLEMEILEQALARSKAGHAEIVAVVGEAGVGKSRLLHEFRELSQESCLVLETFSMPQGKAFAYLPLLELLREYFQIAESDDSRQICEKVTRKVLMLERDLETVIPYILFLLGASDPGGRILGLSTTRRRENTFEAITKIIICESLRQPVNLLFEDLQWLDSETEAFLAYMIERVTDARILLVVNYRNDYHFSWNIRKNYTELRLAPFHLLESQKLLNFLLGEDLRLDAIKNLILERVDGNPLYMEEVVQSLVEQKTLLGEYGHLRIETVPDRLQIPATVQGVLAARIDRLPLTQKELLQTLSVVGREFNVRLIQQVTGYSENVLYPLLSGLQTADFIHAFPDLNSVAYEFKHILTQEVAIKSLISSRRSELHERTGVAIEVLFRHRTKEHCSELAHHYSLSGNIPKAVKYLHCAGRQALGRSAHREAIGHLNLALELLNRLPDTPERGRKELALRVTLGIALIAAKGYASTEVEENYTRALAVWENDGNTLQYFHVRLGLRNFFSLRGQHEKAYEIGRGLLQVARMRKDTVLSSEAYIAVGSSLLFMGKLSKAKAELQHGLLFYKSEQHARHAALFGQDVGVRGHGFLALTSWYLGYEDNARVEIEEAITLAKSLSHPFSLALSLIIAAKLHQLQHDGQKVREYAEAAIAVSDEQGFPFCLAFGEILRGWALTAQGSFEEGIRRLHQGLENFKATGTMLDLPYFMSLLAEAYTQAGQIERALEAIGEALIISGAGERYHEAEIYRLKGNLILQHCRVHSNISDENAAEACLQQSLTVSRLQHAKSIEIRATLSLVNLLQRQGKTEVARRVLDDALAAFEAHPLRGSLERAAQLFSSFEDTGCAGTSTP
ncbi:AAA family ATPase [Cupriavidus necator]|uniref:Guanylate cyclase domain-containing protein n=1 Tax=Cupriavidus necator TaxID=106590 RepID=A0A367PQ18_CUPNE|nr:adenylate/guanylate cyclase domain-containing protein [Cupriavidus necator]QQX86586.1 AAA family ATPase [Cupriavidus necator]RCJ10002.1 hypothetical protein DDK22_01985 [Cupriavidus necator]